MASARATPTRCRCPHVTAVSEVDNRIIGDGTTGPITKALQSLYFDIIYGRNPKYAHWLTPVPLRQAVPQKA
jgi:hypothetical protein